MPQVLDKILSAKCQFAAAIMLSMITVYSHRTALYLLERGHVPFRKVAVCNVDNEDFTHTVRQFNALDKSKLNLENRRIELISNKRNHRCNYDMFKVRSMDAELLTNHLRRISDGQYAVSPELAFFQVASTMSPLDALLMGMEMCGGYSLLAKSELDPEGRIGFKPRPPLTSVERLVRTLPELPERHRPKGLIRALRYVQDGAESPMETAAYLILCLPSAHGGFGIRRPVLNREVRIKSKLKAVANKASYRYDMLWPENNVAVEYDSAMWHSSMGSYRNDGTRRNHSNYMGITVLTAYGSDFSELKHSWAFAEQLARALNTRLRIRTQDFTRKTMELRARVLFQGAFFR